VVEGEATVILGEESHTIYVNECIHIPIREKHMLANNGKDVMRLIEVQIGDYLGEDDIVRLEDKYGRI
jgi:mannose-1-phosphate guanylyltransferase